jgi:hypothetical protein
MYQKTTYKNNQIIHSGLPQLEVAWQPALPGTLRKICQWLTKQLKQQQRQVN